MRVFVVGTGRCGSHTFAQAVSHVTNYTSAHESWIPPDLSFPDRHIEVSPKLSWVLPRLVEIYTADTFYVHLRRKREEVVESWVGRGRHRGPGLWEGLIYKHQQPPKDYRQTCELLHDVLIRTIELCLRGKTHETVWLVEIEQWWKWFWQTIGAEGDYEKSLAEWDTHYGASKPRGKQ